VHEQRYGYSDLNDPVKWSTFAHVSPEKSQAWPSQIAHPQLKPRRSCGCNAGKVPLFFLDASIRPRLRSAKYQTGIESLVGGRNRIQRNHRDTAALDGFASIRTETLFGASPMTFDPLAWRSLRTGFTRSPRKWERRCAATAFSPNIKERRDYSCAVFDAAGEVLAMGDHMPVHLGSMPMSVASANRRGSSLDRLTLALLTILTPGERICPTDDGDACLRPAASRRCFMWPTRASRGHRSA